jgi:hypothetical protein
MSHHDSLIRKNGIRMLRVLSSRSARRIPAVALITAVLLAGIVPNVSRSAVDKHAALSGIWISRHKTVETGIATGYPVSLGSTGWAPLSAGRPEDRPTLNFEEEKARVEHVIASNGDVFVYMMKSMHRPIFTEAGEKAAKELQPGLAIPGIATAKVANSPAPSAVPGAPPDPYSQCLPRNLIGYPGGFGGAMEVFQSKEHIGVVSEDGNYRMVRLGDIDPLKFTPTYNGISVGHWEGNRLVVVTTGFLGDRGGNNWPMSEQAKVTDTFWLSPDRKVLMVKSIFEDPLYMREPMAQMVYLDRGTSSYEFLPTSCVENVQGAALYAKQFGAPPVPGAPPPPSAPPAP